MKKTFYFFHNPGIKIWKKLKKNKGTEPNPNSSYTYLPTYPTPEAVLANMAGSNDTGGRDRHHTYLLCGMVQGACFFWVLNMLDIFSVAVIFQNAHLPPISV